MHSSTFCLCARCALISKVHISAENMQSPIRRYMYVCVRVFCDVVIDANVSFSQKGNSKDIQLTNVHNCVLPSAFSYLSKFVNIQRNMKAIYL